ncbi:MAG: PA2169 family four-helix-bundle protein [Bacteroidia bacterium]|nr:PA2169 family four-helix-bundle protein [Bacteroidia bacterium]
MDTEKTITVLSALIKINNDRIEGYQAALKEMEDKDLKNLFSEFIKTSRYFKSELVSEVHNMGGIQTEGNKTSGKIFNVWMDVKVALLSEDRNAMLSSCEEAEDSFLETYHNVLIKDLVDINSDQHAIISEQHHIIKTDNDKLKNMREMVPELS